MGDERAETYLKLRAEAELRRRPRLMSAADFTASIMDIRWAGEVLRDAGVLAHGTALRIAAELEMALVVRARSDPRRLARRLDWALRERGDESPTQAFLLVGSPVDVARARSVGSFDGIIAWRWYQSIASGR